jgi:nucleotide-binding universal stress UspA family protein
MTSTGTTPTDLHLGCLTPYGQVMEYVRDAAAATRIPLRLQSLTPDSGIDHDCEVSTETQGRVEAAFPNVGISSQHHPSPGFILVTENPTQDQLQRFNVLHPHDEVRFDPNKRGRILVPLGDGPSGLRATRHAIQIAQATGAHIAFWHTTLKRQGVADDRPPKEHMCDGAIEILEQAQQLCLDAGVPCEEIVAMNPHRIPDGIADAALKHNCHLVVMAHGADTDIGSHTEMILECCPVPTLLVATPQ